jgi:hypothetical protein
VAGSSFKASATYRPDAATVAADAAQRNAAELFGFRRFILKIRKFNT